MKQITKYLAGGLAALALVGCKDKMRELNTNPNTIGTTDPRYMFLSATQDFDYNNRGFMQDIYGNTGVKMQYFVYYTGATDGSYCNEQGLEFTQPGTATYQYSWLYSTGKQMAALQQYIDDNLTGAEQATYQDLRAIAGIVKVYEAFRVFQNYGAAVYSQAFQANAGVLKPEYDIFDNTVYENLDAELKSYITVLEGAPNENTPELGIYDPFYGYVVQPSGAPKPLGDYAKQRTLWKKFANAIRLDMAWTMKAVDAAHFSTVLTETMASGLYESAADGCYAYQNGYGQNSSIYNSDGPNSVSTEYAVTDNFISYLKLLNDPRLPLLARNNSLNDDTKAIKWMQAYFPDSLIQHAYYNKETKTWSDDVSWDGVLDFESDPLMAYQGQSANPYNYDMSGAGQLWGQRNFTFRFYHPSYKPGDVEFNKTLGPWTVTNDGSIIPVSEDFPASFTITNPDTAFTLAMASRPQGRYFVSCGGKTYADLGTNGANGYDGPVEPSNKYYRRPVYTYPEFCFMMAYLTVDGNATGKSADQWYEAGVQAAMEELQADAIRYEVQVATNTEATKIVGVNDGGVYDLTSKIAPYIAANSLTSATDPKEAIVGQVWIYSYNNPQRMWNWWRLTGYPKLVSVKTPAERPASLYWVDPTPRTSTNKLSFPRRCALPQPNSTNNENYEKAKDNLVKQANYGAAYNVTTGRIYWDVQGL